MTVTKKNKKVLDAAQAWMDLKEVAREYLSLCCTFVHDPRLYKLKRARITEIEKTTPTKDLMIAKNIVELENTIRVTEQDLEDALERARSASLTRDVLLMFVILAGIVVTLSA